MTLLKNMVEMNRWASAISRTKEKGWGRGSRDSYHLLARFGSRRAVLLTAAAAVGIPREEGNAETAAEPEGR